MQRDGKDRIKRQRQEDEGQGQVEESRSRNGRRERWGRRKKWSYIRQLEMNQGKRRQLGTMENEKGGERDGGQRERGKETKKTEPQLLLGPAGSWQERI